MTMAKNFEQLTALKGGRRVIALVLSVVFLCSCSPTSQNEGELRQEIQALKAQVTVMQEKLNQLEGRQQTMMEMMKQPIIPPSPPEPMAVPSPPPGPGIMTVSQLLASKDNFLGTRVTVKGMAGPVMVHHKSLMLKSPQGMVEVLFGNLPDPKLIQTLSSTPLDKPLTVTGVVNLPPARGTGAQLQINAEAVEF